jgi:hypothetical protein
VKLTAIMAEQLQVKRLVRELIEERQRSETDRTAICQQCQQTKCGYRWCVKCLETELARIWRLT